MPRDLNTLRSTLISRQTNGITVQRIDQHRRRTGLGSTPSGRFFSMMFAAVNVELSSVVAKNSAPTTQNTSATTLGIGSVLNTSTIAS